MEVLQPGQIRVHRTGGSTYICPEANKKNIVNSISDIVRIEHYKPLAPAVATPPKATGKTKESLLGSLLDDNKINALEFIKWIEESNDIGDLSIVMKGETRKTVKGAYKKRLNELA